jgi:hypothetical protein
MLIGTVVLLLELLWLLIVARHYASGRRATQSPISIADAGACGRVVERCQRI